MKTELLTTRQAAEEAGLSVYTVRGLIRQGRLKATRATGSKLLYIDRTDLQRWMQGKENK